MGLAAWPTYREEETPRLEDARRFYLSGPLVTWKLCCVLAHMEQVEVVVQQNGVGNPHQSGRVLLGAHNDPIHL